MSASLLEAIRIVGVYASEESSLIEEIGGLLARAHVYVLEISEQSSTARSLASEIEVALEKIGRAPGLSVANPSALGLK